MSNAAGHWARQQVTGNPHRKAVLMFLADYADNDWSCYPGQDHIAKLCEMSERTVRRALDDLEEAGLIIRRQRRRPDGLRTSDRYWLNPSEASATGEPLSPRRSPDFPDGVTGQRDDDSPDSLTGYPSEPHPPVEPPEQPISSTTPPAPADNAPSEEVEQLCNALADAVGAYRDGAQGGRPKVTKTWLRDMRLLLERGPLGADQATAIPAERVAACIAVVFRELAEPEGRAGFCWAKNVQSPSALRRHWFKIYVAARDQRARSQLGRMGPLSRSLNEGQAPKPMSEILAEHAAAMGRAAPELPAGQQAMAIGVAS